MSEHDDPPQTGAQHPHDGPEPHSDPSADADFVLDDGDSQDLSVDPLRRPGGELGPVGAPFRIVTLLVGLVAFVGLVWLLLKI